MKKHKDKVIILKCTKYGEADLIVKALKQDGGQISLLARSALKSKRRFGGGVLEPTHFVELTYTEKSREDRLATLEEAILIESFPILRKDYDRLELALYVIECAGKVAQENENHAQDLFNLVGNSLKAIEKINLSEKSNQKFRLHFDLKLLFQQGVLEPEVWMQTYLKTAIADHPSLENFLDPQLDFHKIWAENRLREYLSTGTLTS